MTATAERRKLEAWLALKGFGDCKISYIGKWRGMCLPGQHELTAAECEVVK